MWIASLALSALAAVAPNEPPALDDAPLERRAAPVHLAAVVRPPRMHVERVTASGDACPDAAVDFVLEEGGISLTLEGVSFARATERAPARASCDLRFTVALPDGMRLKAPGIAIHGTARIADDGLGRITLRSRLRGDFDRGRLFKLAAGHDGPFDADTTTHDAASDCSGTAEWDASLGFELEGAASETGGFEIKVTRARVPPLVLERCDGEG